MSEEDGLLHAYVLNSGGPAEARDWTTLAEPVPAKGYVWLHLDRSVEQSQSWLIEQSGLDPVVSEALLAPETRPRSTRFETGVLVILRAVNLNPGADPEDMVSLRIWIEPKRIISLRSRRVMAVGDLLDRIERGQAPKSPTGLLILHADRGAAHIEPVKTRSTTWKNRLPPRKRQTCANGTVHCGARLRNCAALSGRNAMPCSIWRSKTYLGLRTPTVSTCARPRTR